MKKIRGFIGSSSEGEKEAGGRIQVGQTNKQ